MWQRVVAGVASDGLDFGGCRRHRWPLRHDHLVGVVKSQSDPDLVYSCRLNKDGDYACCTQNLNVCGGLRGALCKHLLVLIIGLTKGGELDPTLVKQWITASVLSRVSSA